MKFLLGTKQYMTQAFDDNGTVRPCTVLRTAPMTVTEVKTLDRDGYEGVQIGCFEQKPSRVNRAQRGSLGDMGVFRYLREFRINKVKKSDVVLYEKGQKITAEQFTVGDKVQVAATSKGKGFQGGVKRHGFHGGPRTHGQKHSEREPGSIGATGPQRVFKGTRMAGRMGADRITVKNLKIVRIDNERNELYIEGAIPGRKGTLVEVLG